MKDLINIRLEEIRKEHKLSRKDIEDISGFNHLTIGGYERGNRTPSKEYIEFISLYFGYTKEYIEGKSEDKILDYSIKVLLMYQKIFNHNDETMANELSFETKEEYINLIKSNDLSKQRLEDNLYIAFSLNIKNGCFGKGCSLYKTNEIVIQNTNFNILLVIPIDDINKIRNPYKIKIDNIFKKQLEEDIKTYLKHKEDIVINNINGLDINPSYYASIIKQRNNPEIVTPNTQKELIPDKYKEIIELLPFAPDSFTQNLKDKLLEMKKAQQLDDL